MSINATQSHSGEHLVAKRLCNPEICLEKNIYIVLTYSFLFDVVSQSFDKRYLTYLLMSTSNTFPRSQARVARPLHNELYSDNIHSHLTNKSQQTSTHSKFIGTCHYQHFKISTHHTNTQNTTLASYHSCTVVQQL